MQITVFEVFFKSCTEFHTEQSPVSHNIKQGCIRLLCYSLYNNNISLGYINIICYITTYKKPTSNPTYVYDFLCDSILKYVTLENKVNLKCDKIVTIHLKYIFIEVYIYSRPCMRIKTLGYLDKVMPVSAYT